MARSVKKKIRSDTPPSSVNDSIAPSQQPAGFKRRQALSGWPMIIGWLAMLIFALHASTHMVAAGDTWVAMACGRHFVNHGVDTVEPFSANSHKPGPTPQEVKTWPRWARWITDKVGINTVKVVHPTGWVNQNWLTHVIFYWLSTTFGSEEQPYFNALVFWKFSIYILTIICVYYTGKILGANPALCAALACFAMFAGRSFFDVRPAGFSNLLVAVFLLILALATYRNILFIWLIVPLGIFWCNVHGGYIYLFIMLVPFVFLNLLTSIPNKIFVSIGLKGVRHTVLAGVAAFVAVLVFNPFHLTNLTHTFVISVSEHAARWRDVREWHPAFEWSNEVGTAFPFLLLFIPFIGILMLWLLGRNLKPKLIQAPKNELQQQERLFRILSTVFFCLASVFIGWVVFLSFSFLSLDATSFLVCTVFIGILLLSIYKRVHYVYLVIPLTLLALWSADPKNDFLGRYIYPFCLLPAYVLLHFAVTKFSENNEIRPKNIAFVVLTAFVTILLMSIIFNPLKIDFSSGLVYQLLHLQRTWHPEYESNLDLSYSHLFIGFYVVNLIAVMVWFIFANSKRTSAQPPIKISESQEVYNLPKIDLALIIIAALTVYMAIRSRRFIPIAAIAACPIVAMLIHQMICAISAARNFHKYNCLVVSPVPKALQTFFIIAGVGAVIFFGMWWGLKFKYVYLDVWPRDSEFNSVFMRMTASGAKPFYACRFIRDNNIRGKMFNYWTEGGFIAWGQEPDPNTGRTPLQLFMDGRAQAAYDRRAFDLWTYIFSVRPIIESARLRRRDLTSKEYIEMGEWIGRQLKTRDVWVVLIPAAEFNKPFVRGLEHSSNWRLVFYNNKQKLFVDCTTPQGKKLFNGIFDGTTLYPDEFTKSLVIARNMLLDRRENLKKKGLDFAIQAFNLNPSPAPMLDITLIAARNAKLKTRVNNFCQSYYQVFLKNKNLFAEQHGYASKLEAARFACIYLARTVQQQADRQMAQFYTSEAERFRAELENIIMAKRW
jgi:hypothetical protein